MLAQRHPAEQPLNRTILMTEPQADPATPASPAPELRRLTTRYLDHEDRIRLAGELANGQVQVLWLTQRLLNRLLPHLWQWLNLAVQNQPQSHDSPAAATAAASPGAQAELQRFAQQSAAAQRQQQTPVNAAQAELTLLVQSVDITQLPAGLKLVFKAAPPAIGNIPTLVPASPQPQAVCLTLATQPMRQWLHILYQQYEAGGWAVNHWPAWLRPEAASPAPTGGRVLH